MSMDFLKSLYYEFLSHFVCEKIQYKIEGKCNQCGECCRQIRSHGMKNEKDLKIMQFFLPHYKRFFIKGKDEDGNLILSCIYLDENGKCKVYNKRPDLCKNYPAKIINCNGIMPEGCGYKIIKKDFKDYL